MLSPDTRTVLIEQLRPPVGYELEAAVATTFTLQLSAALVPPLGFAAGAARSAGSDPVSVLRAVQASAERIDIFCQAGQIAVPQRASDLMAFLEQMVHPVRPPSPHFLFHPKIWFARYTADGQPDAFRLLCLTRNLADSQAWDAAVVLDGVDTGQVEASNEPLVNLLEQLPDLAVSPMPKQRASRVRDLAKRARRLQWELPKGVQSLKFHVWGVEETEPSADFSGLRHLVVAPFANEEGLRVVTGGGRRIGKNTIIVSRQETLDAIPAGPLEALTFGGDDGSCFVLDPLAELAVEEEEILGADGTASSSGPTAPLSELVGLHAKILVIEKNRKAHVFIGSANATDAAYGGNVEFAVELVGSPSSLGIRALLPKLAAEDSDLSFRRMLQRYSRSEECRDPEDDELRRLERVLRGAAATACEVQWSENAQSFDLHLVSDRPLTVPDGHRLVLSLMTKWGLPVQHVNGERISCRFGSVPLADVTPFFIMELESPDGMTVSTIIHAPLENGGPGGRLDAVLARQIDTREKFLQFLALVLGLFDTSPFTEIDATGRKAERSWNMVFGAESGLMELVVGALADHPKTLKDLDVLVTRLRATPEGQEILPEGFDALWDSVTRAMGRSRTNG